MTFPLCPWVDSPIKKLEISSPSISERSQLPLYELWLCQAKVLVFYLSDSGFIPHVLGVVWAQLCPRGGFGEKAGTVPVLRLINGTVLSAF